MTSPEPLLIIAALLLDLTFGDPRWLPHPVVAIGRMIHVLDEKLRRNRLDERVAGIFLLIVVVGCAAGCTWGVLKLLSLLSPVTGWFGAVLVSATCLAARSLHTESARVASALNAGDLAAARHFLSYIVGRDTEHLEEPEIWRAVIETVAENTSDGIIAPLFWLTAGGPVAAISYKAVSTLDSMVGYRNERYLRFGWASARMDDVLNYIPARISALVLILSAPLAGCSLSGAVRITLRDRLNHPSPNSGHPEAAAAGALGVRFGGEARYQGVLSVKKHIGDPLRQIDARTYRSMIVMMYISTLLMAILCLAVISCLRGIRVPFI